MHNIRDKVKLILKNLLSKESLLDNSENMTILDELNVYLKDQGKEEKTTIAEALADFSSIDSPLKLIIKNAGYRKQLGDNLIEYTPPTINDSYYYEKMHIVSVKTVWDSLSQKTRLMGYVYPCFRFQTENGNKYCLATFGWKTSYDANWNITWYISGRLYQQVGKELQLLTGDEDCNFQIHGLYDGDNSVEITSTPAGTEIPIKVKISVVTGAAAGTEYIVSLPLPNLFPDGMSLNDVKIGTGSSAVTLTSSKNMVVYNNNKKTAKIFIQKDNTSITINKGDVVLDFTANPGVEFLIEDGYTY